MSKKAKTILAIIVICIVALGVTVYLLRPSLLGTSNRNANENQNATNSNVTELNLNENNPVGTYNETSSVLNENVAENNESVNVNTNENQIVHTDLEEQPPASVTPVGQSNETSTGEELPPAVTRNPDGTIRTIAKSQVSDLDPQILSSTCYDVMLHYCEFSDLQQRKEYLSTHLDLGSIKKTSSVFYRDYVTDYRESSFISSNMYNIVVGQPSVKCYYSGGGQCQIPISYTRVWQGDHGASMQTQVVTNYYDIFLTDDYKVWNAHCFRTETA